jgi:transcriptional regulator with XRE-family HTH domain
MTDDEKPAKASEASSLFGRALRQARLKYGLDSGQGSLSQHDFAVMLGIGGDRPEERYGLYENGKREPPLWILKAIREVTGYSLDDLIAQLPPGRRLGGGGIGRTAA